MSKLYQFIVTSWPYSCLSKDNLAKKISNSIISFNNLIFTVDKGLYLFY
jgi:hypothetical protein